MTGSGPHGGDRGGDRRQLDLDSTPAASEAGLRTHADVREGLATSEILMEVYYTQEDMERAFAAHLRHAWRHRWLWMTAVGLLAGIMGLLGGSGPMLALGVYFVLLAFGLPWFMRRSLARNFIRDPTWHELFSWRVAEDGILAHRTHVDSRVGWPIIQKVIEDRHVYLLYPQRQVFWIIPKRAFASADDEEQFRAILYRKGLLPEP